jgi:hypothetical protein
VVQEKRTAVEGKKRCPCLFRFLDTKKGEKKKKPRRWTGRRLHFSFFFLFHFISFLLFSSHFVNLMTNCRVGSSTENRTASECIIKRASQISIFCCIQNPKCSLTVWRKTKVRKEEEEREREKLTEK